MKKKIKILHVIPIFATGGAERLVLQYAKLFDKETYEIFVASCVDDGELRKKFEELKNISVYIGSRREGGRIRAYQKLAEYVAHIQPDIIHTHLLSADLFGYLMKKRYGNRIRWITTMHNIELATSLWRQLLWKFILKKAEKVISVSERVEKFTHDIFHIKKDRSVVSRNGVETEQWLRVPVRMIGRDKTLHLASVGRLWEQKGHVFLLQALALINDIPTVLHIFGDGPLRKKLQAEAHHLGIEGRVIWHGIQGDMPQNIKDIDIVVQASLWEGLSLVVMEMMAAGKIVITTPAGGDELIDNGHTGFIVPVKNSSALAEKIRFVYENKKNMDKIARAARAYAQENFDISKNIHELEKIYTNIRA